MLIDSDMPWWEGVSNPKGWLLYDDPSDYRLEVDTKSCQPNIEGQGWENTSLGILLRHQTYGYRHSGLWQPWIFFYRVFPSWAANFHWCCRILTYPYTYTFVTVQSHPPPGGYALVQQEFLTSVLKRLGTLNMGYMDPVWSFWGANKPETARHLGPKFDGRT